MNVLVEELRETMDWSKFDPPGGIKHFNGLKDGCVPVLADAIGDLEKQKKADENLLARWDGIAKWARRLYEDFQGVSDSPDFMKMIGDFDKRSLVDLPRPGWLTVENWIETGKAITRTLNAGTHHTDPIKERIARDVKEIAFTTALRNVMDGFVTICEIEFALRNAPVRFRTRLFRDLTREVGSVATAGGLLNFKDAPDHLAAMERGVAKIMDEARQMQRICKLLKKEVERRGETIWTGLEMWLATKRRTENGKIPASA